MTRGRLVSWGAAAALSFSVLYAPVVSRLVKDWAHDDNYSHGFLIVPLAAYFAWERRQRLRAVLTNARPSTSGLLIVLLGFFTLFGGLLGADLFLSRISIVVTLTGATVFVLGWNGLKALAFPIGFLLLMIPIPAIIFNQIAFPLQLLASRAGEVAMTVTGVPVLREGNVMILAHTKLEVAEACSGIRSLVSLLTLGVVLGYFIDPRPGLRIAIAVLTVPIAVVTNGLRVAGTGIAAHYYGAQAAEGFFHQFSGWLVFTVALMLVYLAARLLVRVVPLRASIDSPALA